MGPSGELQIGMCFDRGYPPPFVVEVAEALEGHGVDQLWVIEDCFYTAGISLAATALARTDQLQVGIGILPVVARNPAITAMELATLAELAPGRLIAGLGHGVQEWMGQMGARVASPLTALEETLVIVRRLLAGERLDLDGRLHQMHGVQLDQPPTLVPPVLAGVRQAKSLGIAGEHADGVILVGGAGPSYVRSALEQAAPRSRDKFRVTVFTTLSIDEDGRSARAAVAPFLAELIGQHGPALERHPHIDEMRERLDKRGLEGLTGMPSEWWTEFGAIGTFEDALTHAESLRAAGVDDIAMFPAPEVEIGREQIGQVARLRAAIPR